ncbi:hypothetical protein ACROYT_G035309 [Oculina patagonica]
MKLVFIVAVLVFLLDNPIEGKVPDLPPYLVHLKTYLQNQEDMFNMIQADLTAADQTLAKLSADVLSQGILLQRFQKNLTVTYQHLTKTYSLITACLKHHE